MEESFSRIGFYHGQAVVGREASLFVSPEFFLFDLALPLQQDLHLDLSSLVGFQILFMLCLASFDIGWSIIAARCLTSGFFRRNEGIHRVVSVVGIKIFYPNNKVSSNLNQF